ncbi:alpha/beta family hydrolase [Cellulomonas massiliensis]|uniref:alpha/beta hydrolase family protein n=1 Tax=Cellulomonas massiliensis TaxID=1465811 RepID=UPI0003136937|nr:alpha/beta family hydrolase [Cellulomonas massiliensis]
MDVAGLLLTPGAGATRDNRTLVALERVLDPLPVRRVDLPRQASAAVRVVRQEADRLADELGVDPARVALGGRSFGGRMCSTAVAEGQPAAALVLLSYPLHPPGRPEQLRTAHLPSVGVPMLAVSGEKDPFGSPDELRHHLAAVAGPFTLELVPGAHSPAADVRVATIVRDWLAG